MRGDPKRLSSPHIGTDAWQTIVPRGSSAVWKGVEYGLVHAISASTGRVRRQFENCGYRRQYSKSAYAPLCKRSPPICERSTRVQRDSSLNVMYLLDCDNCWIFDLAPNEDAFDGLSASTNADSDTSRHICHVSATCRKYGVERTLLDAPLQPFSQKSRTPTVAKEFQIGLHDPAEGDLELFCNSWSEGFLGDWPYNEIVLYCWNRPQHRRGMLAFCGPHRFWRFPVSLRLTRHSPRSRGGSATSFNNCGLEASC